MATYAETKAVNEAFFEQLYSPGGLTKEAVDGINDFTRTRMREDSFYRKIIPPQPIGNDELDRQVHTDKPAKVIDKEPDAPVAISIPFNSMPQGVYIRGPRYLITFSRIVSPRFTKDVDELRTYDMDIRQVLSDNAIKDMLAEEDSQLIAATNTALVGADTPTYYAGVPQWETINGGITRETLHDAFKIMNRTPAHLEVATVLCNNVTIKEVQKWGRDEFGGDMSERVLQNGWAETDFMGVRWIITIKRDLVPDDSIYMYSDPKFIGKNLVLEDCVMYVKKEAYIIDFFAYETVGGTLGHVGGLARADFV